MYSMSDTLPLHICYLVLLPYSPLLGGEEKGLLHSPKGAPYFYENDISVSLFPIREVTLQQIPVTVKAQVLDEQVWLAECHYTLPAFGDEKTSLKNHQLQEELKKLFMEEMYPQKRVLMEEYTVLLIEEKTEKPDDFIDNNARVFSEFIRGTFDKPLDTREVTKILSARLRYSEQDMTVVDWNGAIIVTDDSDFQSDIDLLKIGNYQLMRYRMLDDVLEDKLSDLKQMVDSHRRMFWPRKERLLQDIINQRLSLLMGFEKLDQSFLLIGDWYSSQLYEVIVNEFYLSEWKKVVEYKLEYLRSIHELVSENLSFSWNRIIEFITFLGWFVMMIGYFVLFYLDARHR